MSNNAITFAGKAALDSNAHEIITNLPESARQYAFAAGSVAHDYNAFIKAVGNEAEDRRSKAAKEIAMQSALLKRNYDIKKDKNAIYTTWGEFAENVLEIASATFSRLSNVGEVFYLSKNDKEMRLCDWYPAFTLAELLPMRDNMEKVKDAMDSAELSPDMSQSDVREWVDANRTQEPKVEKLSDFVFNGKRLNNTLLSKWEAENIPLTDFSSFDKKLDIFDKLPDGREIPWIQRIYYSVESDGDNIEPLACSIIYHAHKKPKTGKDGEPIRTVDKWAVLRASMERCGFTPEQIDALIEAEKAKEN